MSEQQRDITVEQASSILSVALAANFYERYDGELPSDESQRVEDAQEMLRQCRLSYRAGNRKQGVLDILEIAGDGAENSNEGEAVVATTQEYDLQQHSSELLGKILETLENNRASARSPEVAEDISNNIDLVREEVMRRANSGDADAEKIAQTFTDLPAPTQEQAAPQINRKALEDRLTYPIMRAHDIDPSQINNLSDDELQWVIGHPEGGDYEADVQSPAQQQAPAPTGETVETTRMVVKEPEPDPAPPQKVEKTADDPSEARLRMEEQVSGPMLKVFGRGRNEIADGTIGDHELRFMLDHPDGKASLDDLRAAQELDRQECEQGVTEPEPEDDTPTIAQQMAAQSGAQDEPEGDGFTPAPAAEEEKPKRTRRTKAEMEAARAQEAAGAAETKAQVEEPTVEALPRQAAPQRASITHDLPANPAQDIIDRENLPIPPDIEEAVRLPFDLSKLSENEIRSYHSRMHAIHSRALYVLGLWEADLRDAVKARKYREVQMMNSFPATPKLTDAQREAKIKGDPEVISCFEKEHHLDGICRQLRLLAENYGRDVAVCSRQLGRSDLEESGAR